MKKRIGFLLLILLFISQQKNFGQSLSLELNGMDKYWSVNGSFSANLNKSKKLSFSAVNKFVTDYSVEKVKLLVLSNAAYAITKNFKTTAGAMYSNSSGIKPTVGIQGTIVRGGFMAMCFPNLTIVKQPEMMFISMIQYIKNLNEKSQFVARMQSLGMVNSREHLFSTFRFRSGLIRGKCQFGLASDLNFSGSDFDFNKSLGLFLQYQLF